MIGHKDISMTDRYSHLTLKHKLLHQKRLASFYANGGSGGDLPSGGEIGEKTPFPQ